MNASLAPTPSLALSPGVNRATHAGAAAATPAAATAAVHAAAQAAAQAAAHAAASTLAHASQSAAQHRAHARTRQRIEQTLQLLQEHLTPTRRILRAGDLVAHMGEPLSQLQVIHFGCVKSVHLTGDGREQLVGLHFKGDWLGLDGIHEGRQACDVVALDTTEVWGLPYDALLQACVKEPALMALMHGALSREIGRDREALLALCTLPADARVADFLHRWAQNLAARGLRTDQITLPMTRAEIGNFLGMKLETVSRALARLAREQLIAFSSTGRRDLQIADVAALADFVQRCLALPASTSLVH